MNIFVLDQNPKLAAQYHCDKHVVKMITETAQILCSTIYRLNGIHTHKQVKENKFIINNFIFKDFPRRKESFEERTQYSNGTEVHPYGLGYVNHPCNIWSYESFENFKWLLELGFALSEQYTLRYKKVHRCHSIILWVYSILDTIKNKFKCQEMTLFALAMKNYPDIIKKYKNDPIKAYRLFYYHDKKDFAKWNKLNNKPIWYSALEESPMI